MPSSPSGRLGWPRLAEPFDDERRASTNPESIGRSMSAVRWAIAVWLASALYVLPFVDRSWVPHDEGLLGQAAERVNAGELPHRDFDEVYTGGLAYLHAMAFRIAGVKLVAIRWTLFACFLFWVPAVFWIASRSASPPAAAFATALAVVWSLPNYFASMPSWYNLFFATFGVAALFRYLDTRRARWLFLAGAAGGMSFLIKSAGVYYVAAALLALVVNDAVESAHVSRSMSTPGSGAARPGEIEPPIGRYRALVALKCVLAAVIVAAVARLVRTHTGPMPILHFVLPVAAVCALLVSTELHAVEDRGRFRRLVSVLSPFAAGAVLPVAVFLLPYALSHSIGDFVRGVFVTPQQRLAAASADLPPIVTLQPLVPYALLLCMGSRAANHWFGRAFGVVLAGTAGFFLILSAREFEYWTLWNMSRHLNIAAVLAGTLVALSPMMPPSRSGDGSTPAALAERVKARERLLLLLWMTAFGALIEFPFAAPIYFCYFAPLVVLLLSAIVASSPVPKLPHIAVAASLLLFAVLHLNRGFIFNLGLQSASYEVVPADIGRIGLRVEPNQREDYRKLIRLIFGHATGPYVYATPDCPEVYFVSGFANPTRTFYETFDRRRMTAADVLRLIETRRITVVVINQAPEFSGPLGADVAAALAMRFPNSDTAGRYLVRWGT